MKIYFAFQCHNFQRRTCWMLSSILQQSIWLFDIIIDIACMKNNGIPSTEIIAQIFRGRGMDVRLTVIQNKKLFARRGMVRNIQTQNAIKEKANYIFYADADNVYHPDFFKCLIEKLQEIGNTGKCIYSAVKRYTMVKETNDMIESSLSEMPVIDNAYERALSLPVFDIPKEDQKTGAAAGCMQVVSIADVIKNCGGIYSTRYLHDRDMFEEGQLARSDLRFRNRMGGSKKIRLPIYIHLQHIRDKEIGYHTEEQR